jgi:hypothetical protein
MNIRTGNNIHYTYNEYYVLHVSNSNTDIEVRNPEFRTFLETASYFSLGTRNKNRGYLFIGFFAFGPRYTDNTFQSGLGKMGSSRTPST